MNIRYRVTLTEDERGQLQNVVSVGKGAVRRIKRAQSACSCVRYKVYIGELLETNVQVCLVRRFGTGENRPIRRRKMTLDAMYLDRGVGQVSIVMIR